MCTRAYPPHPTPPTHINRTRDALLKGEKRIKKWIKSHPEVRDKLGFSYVESEESKTNGKGGAYKAAASNAAADETEKAEKPVETQLSLQRLRSKQLNTRMVV